MRSVPKYVGVKVGPGGKMPFRKYSGDAGYDLYVSEDIIIPPNQTADVHTNVYIQMPPFVFARITGRSSTLRNHGLIVNEGIIDNGYTGELFIAVHNMTDQPFQVVTGMRLAQIIFQRIENVRMSQVDEIETRVLDRAERGFGSTGV